jgi:putative MATE family efflux protein
VGISSGLESLLFRGAQMTFYRVVAGLGTAVLAAQQVVINATSIAFLPGFGFAVAGTALVGQGLGAKDPRRAEQSGYLAFLWGGGFMVGIGLLLLAFPGSFMRFFTEDPQVIKLGILPLRVLGLAQPPLAAAMIFAGALRGAGDTRAPLWINAISLWTIRLPLAALFTQGLAVFFPGLATSTLPPWLRTGLHWGLWGAWVAVAIDLTVRGSLMLLRYRGGRWKEIEV